MTDREALMTRMHVEQMRMQHANWRLRRRLNRCGLAALLILGLVGADAVWAACENQCGVNVGVSRGYTWHEPGPTNRYGGYVHMGPYGPVRDPGYVGQPVVNVLGGYWTSIATGSLKVSMNYAGPWRDPGTTGPYAPGMGYWSH